MRGVAVARHVPPEQTSFARRLRRDMTAAETIIWRSLRAGRLRGAKFRRQVPIGPFVADFLCFEARLIVELDGPPHEVPERRQHDERRDAWLRRQGFRVLRFPNDLAVGGTELLIAKVEQALADTESTPHPSGSA
jgi:very-short-patch-repair endonuclease